MLGTKRLWYSICDQELHNSRCTHVLEFLSQPLDKVDFYISWGSCSISEWVLVQVQRQIDKVILENVIPCSSMQSFAKLATSFICTTRENSHVAKNYFRVDITVNSQTFQSSQIPTHNCKIHEMSIHKCNPRINAMFEDVNGSDDLFVMFAKSFLQNFLADSW